LERLNKYQLPNVFRKIGYIIFGIFSIVLILGKLFIDGIEIGIVVKYGILTGLLLVSISKEKIEDELVLC
jgi:hypothetical protein